jgi:hypothetical protein
VAIKAVVLDLDGTLLDDNNNPVAGIPEMIAELKNLDLHIAIASNRPNSAPRVTRARLDPDLFMDRNSIGATKGSPTWVAKVTQEFQIENNELVWLGDTDNDMRSAINTKVMYFHAGWSVPQYPYGINVQQPSFFPLLLREFFIKPVDWYWEYSGTDHRRRKVTSKAMMDSRGAGIEVFQWDLINFLKDGGDPTVGLIKVRHFIMFHFLGSLYGDQFYRQADIWTVYPGSKGGTNAALGPLANIIARLFRERYISDLLIRHTPSIDSGEARRQQIQVDFFNQANTMRLNEAYRRKIEQKTVVVLDDFITRGYSMECARNLLLEAGAGDVICVNIGKYASAPRMITHSARYPWNPYDATTHQADQFQFGEAPGTTDRKALEVIRESYKRFEAYARGRPI